MFKLLRIVTTILLLQTTISSDSSDSSSSSNNKGVITLTARTFDSSLRDGQPWLIEFYAPWCGHCKSFAPTYEMVALKLHKTHSDEYQTRKIKVAKVDGAAERALASRFAVKGYPSFYLVEGWKVYPFEGTARSFDNLIKFANESYVEVEPIPFLMSPFGPLGQSRAFLIYAGVKIVEYHEWLVERGLSPTVAAALLAFLGIVSALFTIICIGLLAATKVKTD